MFLSFTSHVRTAAIRQIRTTSVLILALLLTACGGGGGGGGATPSGTPGGTTTSTGSIIVIGAFSGSKDLKVKITSPTGATHTYGSKTNDICTDRTGADLNLSGADQYIECTTTELEPGIYQVTVINSSAVASSYNLFVKQGTTPSTQIANGELINPGNIGGPHTFQVGTALDLGGEIGGGTGVDPSATVADIAGIWSFSDEVTAATGPCSSVGDTDTSTLTISTDGSNGNITIYMDEGVYTGMLMGNELSWTGSFPTNGGTATFGVVSLVVSADGSSMSGSIDATWTNGSTNCAVTFSESGTRTSLLAAPISDITGDWNVTYTNTTKSCGAVGGGATYPATITMTGNNVVMTWNGNDYAGTIDGDQLSFVKDFSGGVSGGGVTVTINATVSSDGSSFSGTQDWVSASPVCSGTDSFTGVLIPADEGSLSSPVPITVGTPYAGTVAADGNSFYGFTATSPGTYIIKLTNVTAANAGLLITTTSGVTVPTCNNSAASAICSVNLDAGTGYVVRVSNTGAGGKFTLIVPPPCSTTGGTTGDQGTLDNPVAICENIPYVGSFITNVGSFYGFTAITTGGYVASATNISPAPLRGYISLFKPDGTSQGSIGPIGSSTLEVYANLIAGSNYVIQVHPQNNSNSTTFTLTVAPQ